MEVESTSNYSLTKIQKYVEVLGNPQSENDIEDATRSIRIALEGSAGLKLLSSKELRPLLHDVLSTPVKKFDH